MGSEWFFFIVVVGVRTHTHKDHSFWFSYVLHTCTEPCLSAGVRLPNVFCLGTSGHAVTPPFAFVCFLYNFFFVFCVFFGFFYSQTLDKKVFFKNERDFILVMVNVCLAWFFSNLYKIFFMCITRRTNSNMIVGEAETNKKRKISESLEKS